MHLYMYSEFSKEIANITLKDGCCPCIGDQVSEQLEPALWFKVLVLDAISIDCNKRLVQWHTSTDLQSIKEEDKNEDVLQQESLNGVKYRQSSRRFVRRQLSDSIYTGGECLGLSCDLDEVYDFTQEALSNFASGEISQTAFNREIFRLLHIHILPNIKLSSDDIMNVQDAMAIVDTFISDMDEMILEKQNKIDRVEQDMSKQRLRLVDKMADPDFSCHMISLPMVEVLHRQLREDIFKAQEHLEDMTRQVEAAKEFLQSSGESDASSLSSGEEDLSRLREQRDDFLMMHFNKLLTARAVLDNHMKPNSTCLSSSPDLSSELKQKIAKNTQRRSKGDSPKEKAKKDKKKSKIKAYSPKDEKNPLHATYMGMEQTYKELIEDIQSLAQKKVLQLSVKESIRGVLQVLLCGHETSGVETNLTGSQHGTDVMRHSQIPMEWLSLAEQVATVINNSDFEISRTHQGFCDHVRDVCLIALQQRKLSELSNSIDQSSTPKLSPTDNGGLYTENKLYNLAHPDVDSSDRSSGFSSSYQSDASRISENDRSQDSALKPSNVLVSHPSTHSSCEVLSFSPDSARSSHEHQHRKMSNFSNDPIPELAQVLESNARLERSRSSDGDYLIHETSDVILVEEEVGGDLEMTVDKLKGYIMKQFEEICEQLLDHLGYIGDVYFKKIWQCYETHFYHETMEILSRLYVDAYTTKFQNVLENLSSLTAGDLDLSGFIVDTLQDSVQCLITDQSGTMRTDSTLGASTSNGSVNDSDSVDHDRKNVISEMINHDKDVLKPASRPNSLFRRSQKADDYEMDNLSERIPSVAISVEKSESLPSRSSKGFSTDMSKLRVSMSDLQETSSESSSQYTSTSSSEQSIQVVPFKEDRLSPQAIKITLPTETTLIYDRHTWPLLESPVESQPTDNNISLGAPLSPTVIARGKSTQFKSHVRKEFQEAFDMVDIALKDSSPLHKLQQLVRCLRAVSNQYQRIQTQYVGASLGANADELIDILVLFLCNVDMETARRLYAHVILLSHYLPRFFEGGPLSFTLVQFSAGFQVLQDRLVMKTKKLNTESEA